jgi:hypothetical protein
MIEMEADTPFRVFEYHALSSIALAADAPPGKKPLRIRSGGGGWERLSSGWRRRT